MPNIRLNFLNRKIEKDGKLLPELSDLPVRFIEF